VPKTKTISRSDAERRRAVEALWLDLLEVCSHYAPEDIVVAATAAVARAGMELSQAGATGAALQALSNEGTEMLEEWNRRTIQ